MATLVLSTVGTIFGGPLGGAIGSFIGSQIDGAIIGSGPDREGARLAEVSVQTSSYGNPIPQIFGNMRIAGSVIWATDLIENSNKEGGGKGRPSTTTFSYSANFAVALSSRPIAAIGRIWADGNLLRGAQGDFKSETLFRFYTGAEDQMIDPLIASAEGIANASAHRGIAYAVFENMQLENFGNRIPSLTFEIINNFGAVEIVSIASELSQGLIKSEGAGVSILGFAASSSSSREAIENLLTPLPLSLRARDERLELISAAQSPIVIDATQAAFVNGNALDNKQISLLPIGEIAKEYALRYYDPSREYQAGLQSSRRPGPGRRNAAIDYPAALDAADASAIVRNKHNQDIFGRQSMTINFVRGSDEYHSGDIVKLAGHQNLWQILQIDQDVTYLNIELRAIPTQNIISSSPSAGRSLAPRDQQSGQTLFHILDLPAFNNGNLQQPNIAIASAGTQAGWRSATIFNRDGNNLTPLETVRNISTIGTVENAIKSADANIIDYENRPKVRLVNDAMNLPITAPNDEDVYFNAPHFAMLGDEIIAYNRASLVDDGAYVLEGLCRGIGGTEQHIGAHQENERFLLLDAAQLNFIDASDYNVGQSLDFEAIGLGDTEPQVARIESIGKSLTPLSPVHGQIIDESDGGKTLRWVRRGRLNAPWRDGVDIPVHEDREQYALEITFLNADNEAQELLNIVVNKSDYNVPAAQTLSWVNMGADEIIISIVQIGTFARSSPLILPHKLI